MSLNNKVKVSYTALVIEEDVSDCQVWKQ